MIVRVTLVLDGPRDAGNLVVRYLAEHPDSVLAQELGRADADGRSISFTVPDAPDLTTPMWYATMLTLEASRGTFHAVKVAVVTIEPA